MPFSRRDESAARGQSPPLERCRSSSTMSTPQMSRPNALKRAATLTIRAGRFAKTTDVSLQASRETPLQRAVNDLKDLGAALEGEGHSAQADQVVKIITELRSENFHRRASQARIFTELLKDATEAEASDEAAGRR